MDCPGSQSLPHVDVGASPMNSERYFSSGNERTHIRLDEAGAEGTKGGYHLKTSDRFAFIGDTFPNNNALHRKENDADGLQST